MINLEKSVLEKIIQHAKDDFPIEACGYLAGKENIITHNYPMTNADNSSEHFTFLPEEQFSIMKQARNDGLELTGVYHSHPYTPARPSEEDIRMALDPDLCYLIISLANDKADVKAFRIKDLKSEQEELNIMMDKPDIIPDEKLDLRGTVCPINFVKTKLKLEEMQPGQILEVVIDDGEPIRNVPRSVKEEGHQIVKVIRLDKENAFKLYIKKM